MNASVAAPANRSLVVTLAAALALLVIVAFVALNSEKMFLGSEAVVDRTEHNREQIAELKGLLDDAETGERGYLISGEAGYLAPYKQAQPRIAAAIGALRQGIADDPGQQRRLDALTPLIARRLESLRAVIAMRDAQGLGAAAEATRAGQEGKGTMDEIRRLLLELDAHERAELTAQHAAAQTRAAQTHDILWSTLLLAMGIGAVTLLLLRRTAAERLRAFERIREQAALLDETADAISTCDLERRLLYWNRAHARFYGEPRADEPRHFLATDAATAGATWATATAAVVQAGEWSGEFKTTGPGQAPKIVQSRWTLIRDESGKPKSILIVDTDVTEKKEIEARSMQAQRLESIGRLAAGIAHDLNNVLAPIVMGLPLLQDKLTAPADRRVLAVMESSVRRGTAVVRQVLGFAQGHDEHRGAIQLNHIIREVLEVAQATFPKAIRLEAQRPNNLPLVCVDPNQLHQVLLNLCVNARDAMPGGGVLTLTAEAIDVAEGQASRHPGAKPGPHVRLAVCDTGSGIAPELREKIFEPFFTTKGPGRGTGLGLPMVVEIVRNHGGFMELESELGRGSTFALHLPALPGAQADEAVQPPLESLRGHGETILVVDDEAAVRELTKTTLEASGYAAITAADGAEAVAVFAGHQSVIGLVVTDLDMPIMDGRATIAALRRLQPQLPIVAMTGTVSGNAAGDPERLDVQATLVKPIARHDLLGAVREALNT